MTVSSGHITLKKDSQNLIGISIGGGAPLCPCLYVVQVFDNTPAAKDGNLAAGDEIVGVNGQSVKGRTKVEVARLIQSVKVGSVSVWLSEYWCVCACTLGMHACVYKYYNTCLCACERISDFFINTKPIKKQCLLTAPWHVC